MRCSALLDGKRLDSPLSERLVQHLLVGPEGDRLDETRPLPESRLAPLVEQRQLLLRGALGATRVAGGGTGPTGLRPTVRLPRLAGGDVLLIRLVTLGVLAFRLAPEGVPHHCAGALRHNCLPFS